MIPKATVDLLSQKAELYNSPEFIATDPIQIPHGFSKKQDIEIAGLLAATIAWGQRPTIIKNANRMVEFMDHDPHNFILNHQDSDLEKMKDFKHRTFNSEDLYFFIERLNFIYSKYDSLEDVFVEGIQKGDQFMDNSIDHFRSVFLGNAPTRTSKHVSSPAKGSATKRINMFLRWMVRQDNKGVDFGIWNNISPALLSCPLDVHSGNVAREYGLLHRKQNDWKAVVELDTSLREMDPTDPVKYDFALFGIGVFG